MGDSYGWQGYEERQELRKSDSKEEPVDLGLLQHMYAVSKILLVS